jgi:hypothetical protein
MFENFMKIYPKNYVSIITFHPRQEKFLIICIISDFKINVSTTIYHPLQVKKISNKNIHNSNNYHKPQKSNEISNVSSQKKPPRPAHKNQITNKNHH